jgi:hypothetical protein
MDDKYFHPSKELDSYLYSIFLEYASVEELEQDTLHTQTHWQLAKHFDDNCKEYNVWFVDDVAVTEQPQIRTYYYGSYVGSGGSGGSGSTVVRYYDSKNPDSRLNGAVIAPNIEL